MRYVNSVSCIQFYSLCLIPRIRRTRSFPVIPRLPSVRHRLVQIFTFFLISTSQALPVLISRKRLTVGSNNDDGRVTRSSSRQPCTTDLTSCWHLPLFTAVDHPSILDLGLKTDSKPILLPFPFHISPAQTTIRIQLPLLGKHCATIVSGQSSGEP